MRYKTAFPREQVFGWNDVKFLHKGQYILMHSVIYRTKMLWDCGLELPKHTFYVDNIFVFQPLPHVKKMYYLDVNFYRYFIGREDQSVNEKIMIGRIDQQILVTKIIADAMVEYMKKPMNGKLRKYMINYVDIMMTVSSVLLLKSGTEENLEKKKELWEYLKNASPKLYRKIKLGILGRTMKMCIRDRVMIHMGHGHGVYIDAAIKMAKRHPNIYLEMSGMPMGVKIKQAYEEVGADRIMFGTDFPFHHPSVEIQKVLTCGLPEAAQEDVFYNNVKKLFGNM